jgi:hypothetical protein
MDRKRTHVFVNSRPMPTYWDTPSNLLLCTSEAWRVRSTANEENRQDIHHMAFLWLEENSHKAAQGGSRGQPDKSTGAHEDNGMSRHSARSKHFPKKSRTQNIPIPAKRTGHYGASKGTEHRYYLHPFVGGIRESCGHYGLVQQDGSIIPSFEQPRSSVLSRCFRGSVEGARETGDLQYGPRSTIYLCRVCRGDYSTRHSI